MKASAVLLAGGSGSRLRDPSGKKKQYLTLLGKPLVCWSLEVLQRSKIIEDIVLVVPAGDEDYVREEILNGADKVRAVVAGGKERYHSVYEGLKAVQALNATDRIVFIHDGARPFVTEEELHRLAEDVQKTGACVLAVPAKDTIKRADRDRVVMETLKREELWQMQTPQVFRLSMVLAAHERLVSGSGSRHGKGTGVADGTARQQGTLQDSAVSVTDDAMVVSLAFPEQQILLTEGSYRNLKVTTPEDLIMAEALAERVRNVQ